MLAPSSSSVTWVLGQRGGSGERAREEVATVSITLEESPFLNFDDVRQLAALHSRAPGLGGFSGAVSKG